MVKEQSSIIDATILVINDDANNLALIRDVLESHYKTIKVAVNKKEVLKIAKSSSLPDIILLDVAIPKEDSYEICKQLKEKPSTHSIPILFLVENNEPLDDSYIFEMGADDYINKPISPATLAARVNTHLQNKRLKAISDNQTNLLENQIQEHPTNLMVTQYAAIYAMGYLSGVRENITGNHIWRNQHYVKALAEKLRDHPRFSGFLNDDNTIEMLFMTAPLHDIGNVGVPDRILLKPGRLTLEEFEIVKSHTHLGRDVISQTERDFGIEIPILKFAKEIIYSHHEKWDGSGYPEGLAGNTIPIPARIAAIADVYDALIRRLVYKPAVPHDKAVKIILEGRGTHFDPDMIDAFHEIHEDFQRIAYTYADSEQDFRKKIDYLETAIAINP